MTTDITPKKFVNRCLDCGHVQDAGPCEVCPHIPGLGGPNDHYERRPCKICGSANLVPETAPVPKQQKFQEWWATQEMGDFDYMDNIHAMLRFAFYAGMKASGAAK